MGLVDPLSWIVRVGGRGAAHLNQSNLQSLIQRVRDGDSAAVDQLLEQYGDAIRREIRFNLLDQRLRRVVAESDIFQSVISQFVFGLRDGKFEFQSGHDVVNLLKVMVRARVAQHARFWSAQRRDLKRNHPIADQQLVAKSIVQVGGALADAELAVLALALVPEMDQQILQMRDHGLGWAEIAQQLGARSADSARKAHERSLRQVRETVRASAHESAGMSSNQS